MPHQIFYKAGHPLLSEPGIRSFIPEHPWMTVYIPNQTVRRETPLFVFQERNHAERFLERDSCFGYEIWEGFTTEPPVPLERKDAYYYPYPDWGTYWEHVLTGASLPASSASIRPDHCFPLGTVPVRDFTITQCVWRRFAQIPA